MSMRDTLDPRPATVPPDFGDGERRVATVDSPSRFTDPGLDGESGASAPPDNVPAEARSPHVPAEQENPDNIASKPAPAPPAGPTIALDEAAYAAGNTCVQCGLCLPACPTYLETGNEADSPRGRIRQMLGLHDGDVPYTPAGQEHLDRCLDCRACETACPSGVVYHRLIEDARHKLQQRQASLGGGLSRSDRFQRWVYYNILTQPNRLRMALLPARLLQKVGLWSL